jgi:hypothetical protein
MSFSCLIPLIDCNSNISPPSGSLLNGGEIRNPHIVITGEYPFGTQFNPVPRVIVANVNNPHIRITGDYPSCSAGNNGYIEFPDTDFGPSMIDSDGENTTVEGIRTVGLIGDSFHRSINLRGTNGLVQNCVTDQTPKATGSGGTVTNWITNAQWAARCPHVPRQD